MTDGGSAARAPTAAERKLLEAIDKERLPRHVAVIMDGNGRWARRRGMPRIAGHRAGIAAVRAVVEASAELGIEVLTLYAFSRENWKRPKREVDTLFRLLREYLDKELPAIKRHGIRFRPIGRLRELPEPVQRDLERARRETEGGDGMWFLIALSYSGRADIVDAARALAAECRAGRLDPEAIDEETIAGRLSTAGLPDPDLLIRTSGEQRISNFLLWQVAYAELYVTPTLWPDFRRRHLYEAIIDYQRRERRFGGVPAPDDGPSGGGPRELTVS
ncbi:MAG: isoprenyl transferase [Acidobacteria bacterium]|nr:MAG: isoprenyl transferase [Acidobacteriota bacterium]